MSKASDDKLIPAIGAEIVEEGVKTVGDPVSFLALHQRILTQLKSTGGRPGREGVSGRYKVPMSTDEWHELEHVATLLWRFGVKTTPGQVAGFLLESSLNKLKDEIEAMESEAEHILEAAASSSASIQELGPVAAELLKRMKFKRLKEKFPDVEYSES